MIEPKPCGYGGCSNRAWARGLCTTHISRARKEQDMEAPVRSYKQVDQEKRDAALAGVRDRVLAVVREAIEPMTAHDYAWVLRLPKEWTGIEPLRLRPIDVGWILSRHPQIAVTYTANKDNMFAWEPVVA